MRTFQVMFRTITVVAMMSVALATVSQAATPTAMNYQGRLTTVSGTPVPDGSYSVVFTIYDAASGGTSKWTETQSVTTSGGLFAVLLGTVNPIFDAVFSDSSRYLGIKVGADPELTPRNRLVTSGYSFRVSTVDSARGGTIKGNTTVAGQLLDTTSSPIGYNILDAEYTGSILTDFIGVYGKSIPADYYGFGGRFEGGYIGAQGRVQAAGTHSYFGLSGNVANTNVGNGTLYGVYGAADQGNVDYGVYGEATGGTYAYGIYGSGQSASHNLGVSGSAETAVVGTNTGVFASAANASLSNFGIYAAASIGPGNYAGYFSGDVYVNGTLSKTAGAFKIDHPLDPANKYLQHSFVESPDMMNIYNGNVVTDGNGDATITMPVWFDALNKDFRYQLTVIGQFAQAIVSSKMNGNSFSIKTDKSNVEVSWQVTGVLRILMLWRIRSKLRWTSRSSSEANT